MLEVYWEKNTFVEYRKIKIFNAAARILSLFNQCINLIEKNK